VKNKPKETPLASLADILSEETKAMLYRQFGVPYEYLSKRSVKGEENDAIEEGKESTQGSN
jgi:hypothetical protein